MLSSQLPLPAYCSTASAMSLFLAHSGQRMSSLSVMKPLPTMEVLQEEQRKQSLCQCRPSNEMKRVPPMPASRQGREEGGAGIEGLVRHAHNDEL